MDDPKFWSALVAALVSMCGWARSEFWLGKKIGQLSEKTQKNSDELKDMKKLSCVGGEQCEKIREDCRESIVRDLDKGDGRFGRIELALSALQAQMNDNMMKILIAIQGVNK
jgi:hypothetical protein